MTYVPGWVIRISSDAVGAADQSKRLAQLPPSVAVQVTVLNGKSPDCIGAISTRS
jgi:hypothetical protein